MKPCGFRYFVVLDVLCIEYDCFGWCCAKYVFFIQQAHTFKFRLSIHQICLIFLVTFHNLVFISKRVIGGKLSYSGFLYLVFTICEWCEIRALFDGSERGDFNVY